MTRNNKYSKTARFDFEGASFDVNFDESEDTISTEVLRTSSWEPWQLKLYPNLLKNPDSTFLDIGANVGINSIYAKIKCPNTRVISVEPAENNLALLNLNSQNAQIDLEIYPFAISDRKDFIVLVGDAGHAHIGNQFDENSKRVESRQLDQFLYEASIKSIQLLKIDVEGFTDLVLSFSSETLKVTECAIVEFSLSDLDLRFHGEKADIQENIEIVYNTLTNELRNVYYISRTEGLVKVELEQLTELLQVEYTVGDFLFSRKPQLAISIEIFILRKIRTLQHENHLRILENNQRK